VLDGANRGKLRQVLAIRLRDVENVGATESDKMTGCFGGAAAVLLLVIRFRFTLADNRRKNGNPFFSFANVPTKSKPSPETCDMSRIGPLHGDQQAIRPGLCSLPNYVRRQESETRGAVRAPRTVNIVQSASRKANSLSSALKRRNPCPGEASFPSARSFIARLEWR
jgi:hypothetical protein